MKDYTLEIERSLLSAVFADPQSFEEVASRLKAHDFFHKPHQYIFMALLELESAELPFDEEFVLKKSTPKAPIDEEELFQILGTNPVVNIPSYIDEVKNRSIKRRLAHLAVLIKQQTSDENRDCDNILENIEREIFQISQESTQHDFREAEEIVGSTLALIQSIKERGNTTLIGLDTGFYGLNKLTTGFNSGDLIVIAARPSMGKTAFALNIALTALEHHKGVAIFSLEMAAEQLMLRLLSMKTSFALQDLRVGNIDDDNIKHLSFAADELARSPLFVDDGGNLGISLLRSKMRKLKSRHPEVELVIVDYLQLMSATGSRDRHIEVSEISRGLKLLARELQIPVIALSQLNRALEARSDKRPMLSDLRESGAIEQDADLILFIYRDDVYKERAEKEKAEQAKKEGKTYQSTFQKNAEEKAEIIIGKQRNGPTAIVDLIFQTNYSRFVEPSDDAPGISIDLTPTKNSSYVEMPDNVL